MSQTYFNNISLEKLSNKELYFRFKIIEKRNNLSNKIKIPYEMRNDIENMYNNYFDEIENRVLSNKVSYDDMDDWDDFYYEYEKEIIDLLSKNLLDDEHIERIK